MPSRSISFSEVKKHTKPDDCWVIIHNKVYDVSNFGKHHPGGDCIYFYGGRDATCVFKAYHPDYVSETPQFQRRMIGVVPKDEHQLSEQDQAYLSLYDTMEKRGLFKTSALWYAWKIFYPLFFFVLGVWLIYTRGDDWTYLILGCLSVGLAQNQVAFLGHDIAHCSLTQNNEADFWIGGVLALGIFGVSGMWWKYTHNCHHVVTNEWDRDPDITHCPVFSVDKGQYLHPKGQRLNIGEKIILWLSPVLFLPIVLILARFSMYWQGIAMLFIFRTVPTMPYQKLHYSTFKVTIERLLTIFYFGWWTFLGYNLPSWSHRIAMVLVPNLIVGLLHLQLILSHYERPSIYSGDKEEGMSWLAQQVLTGRNIDGDIRNEWIYGGLHYQVEHHLFPRMPRHNHRKAQELVLPLCDKYNIPYARGGFWAVFWSVMTTITEQSRYAFFEPLKTGTFDWGQSELFIPKKSKQE